MKKLVILVTLFLTLGITGGAFAAGEASFFIGNGNYNINGTVRNDVAPYIANGRTYLPLRYVAYSIGIGDNSIDWDPDSKTVYLFKDGEIVSLTVGEQRIYKGAAVMSIDASAVLKGGRVMLPLRAISEAFDCEVDWNPETRIATVISM